MSGLRCNRLPISFLHFSFVVHIIQGDILIVKKRRSGRSASARAARGGAKRRMSSEHPAAGKPLTPVCGR